MEITNTTSLINTRYWVCDPCLYSAWNENGAHEFHDSCVAPLSRRLCVCCPFPGGALKRTLEGEWCHVSCMLLSNHLTVLSYIHMEPIIASPVESADSEPLPFSALSQTLFLHVVVSVVV